MRCLQCFEEYDDQYEICPICGHVNREEARQLHDRYTLGAILAKTHAATLYAGYDEIFKRKVRVLEISMKEDIDYMLYNKYLFNGQYEYPHYYTCFRIDRYFYFVFEFNFDEKPMSELEFNSEEKIVHYINLYLDFLKKSHQHGIYYLSPIYEWIFLSHSDELFTLLPMQKIGHNEHREITKFAVFLYVKITGENEITKKGLKKLNLQVNENIENMILTGITDPKMTLDKWASLMDHKGLLKLQSNRKKIRKRIEEEKKL